MSVEELLDLEISHPVRVDAFGVLTGVLMAVVRAFTAVTIVPPNAGSHHFFDCDLSPFLSVGYFVEIHNQHAFPIELPLPIVVAEDQKNAYHYAFFEFIIFCIVL